LIFTYDINNNVINNPIKNPNILIKFIP